MMHDLFRIHAWYQQLPRWQQWLTLLSVCIWVLAMGLWVTHEPRERKNKPPFILKNCDTCGVDPDRQISAQEYIKTKKQAWHANYEQEQQRLRQEEWDRRGRERWCRDHPRDANCKKIK